MNIKELGYEVDLVHYLKARNLLSQVFLFDMELLEQNPGQTASLLRSVNQDLRIATRISDRAEPVDRALSIDFADIVWLDEFDSLWLQADDIRRLKQAGKIIYAISPEIHGFSFDDMKRRWIDFCDWGVDGICTDYGFALASHLSSAT
jgi:hypothetical protein